MADNEIVLEYSHEGNSIKFGTKLPSTKVNAEMLGKNGSNKFFPEREMNFSESKVVFQHVFYGAEQVLRVFGFKQSMPHIPTYMNSLIHYSVDINHIKNKKTQDEIVAKIRKEGYKGTIDILGEIERTYSAE